MNHYLYNPDKDDNAILILEYANNRTVMDLINENKEFGLNDQLTYTIFSQVLKGVEFLHNKNISHRDLKNENFLIFDGCVKISDFAMSHIENDQINNKFYTNNTMLTYMPPKEMNNFEYDIWCLGISIYEMLHGRLPWYYNEFTNKMRYEFDVVYKKDIDEDLKDLLVSK